jgi:hypothetical protein
MAERFPSWKQALLTFIGGFVLAGTTCFGFVVSLDKYGDSLGVVMAIGFAASLLMILIGFVFVILRIVFSMSDKGRTPPSSPGDLS